MLRPVLGILFCFILANVHAQTIKPGFDPNEYRRLLAVSAQFGDSAYRLKVPLTEGYRMLYESPEMGLKNRWQLWTTNDGKAVINLRGTIMDPVSWMCNFYAAMIPAKGSIQLDKEFNFSYEWSGDPNAAVHTGWTVATAYLVRDILPRVDSIYRTGVKEFYIIGHSQGGAIAYLLTSHLRSLLRQGLLPTDILLKTYCSAAPKPGNLYYAYGFEAENRAGWAYNVVNAADWVPETPFSIQTVQNMNAINPFVDVKKIIRKQKWPVNWGLNHAYGRMTGPEYKSVKNFRKYLGSFVYKNVKKTLPGFVEPEYLKQMDYVRTGNFISLIPDSTYMSRFPQDPRQVFVNHLHPPYLYLLDKAYPQ